MTFACRQCDRPFSTNRGKDVHESHCWSTRGDLTEIRRLYDEDFLSTQDIIDLGFQRSAINFALVSKRRSRSESRHTGHLRHPQVWTEEQRKRQSESKKMMHAERRKILWNSRSEPPRSEKMFILFMESLGLKINLDFFHDFPFGIYRADFFFPNLSLVIEINGGQHYKDLQRKKNDQRKEALLKPMNIDVVWIPATDLRDNRTWDAIRSLVKDSSIRKINIDNFSKRQQERLLQIEKPKRTLKEYHDQRQHIRDKAKEDLKNDRLRDIENLDLKKIGWSIVLANKWNISPQQVKKYVKRRLDYLDRKENVKKPEYAKLV